MDDVSSYAIGGVGVAGILFAVGKMAWDRFFSQPGQAENALYAALNEQLQAGLARIDRLEGEIDDERKLRRLAQIRIARLEQELAKHGIAIPAEAA